MRRAKNLGCFVEVVCLSTSVIDAALRIGLILKYQIAENSDDLKDEILYQSDDGRRITERAIYKRALEENVICKEQFSELDRLYDQRNRVVHRYIISDITTQDVLGIAVAYDKLLDSIGGTIKQLEEEQLATGRGMCLMGPAITIEAVCSFSDPKHGSITLTENLKLPDQPIQ